MVIPAPAFDPMRRAASGRGGAVHVAVRRPDDVHRRAVRPGLRQLRSRRSLRTGIMAGSPCPVEVMKQVHRPDGHARGDDLLRDDRNVAGIHPDPSERLSRATGPLPPDASIRISRSSWSMFRPDRRWPRGEQGELCTRGLQRDARLLERGRENSRSRSTPRDGCTRAIWRPWTTTVT